MSMRGIAILLHCLLPSVIARVKGSSALALETGMSRQGLQKALSSKGNPRMDNINAIIRAMGYLLTPEKI